VPVSFRAVETGESYPANEVRYRSDAGGTLDVVHEVDPASLSLATFDARRASRDPRDRSGVWRFRDLIAPLAPEHVVTRREGDTGLYDSAKLASYVGLDRLLLKHEGENPTGSFKDRGMTVAISVARSLGMQGVACASTGNTSASMAAYAAQAGLKALVFIPDGQIAHGKLSQSLAYGATTLQIAGDFDDAMRLVEDVCLKEGIYLVNSVNPWRIEGQKAIGFEILQDLGWEIPDWIVLPGGNLGNNTAIAKGLLELKDLGLIPRVPRIAVVQAAGAAPLYDAFHHGAALRPVHADTLATAIKIGDPVSWRKSLRGLQACGGTVEKVTDQEILDAKAQVDAAGIGAEPASCATVAGLVKLVAAGTIARDARVVGVLTGHVLKDPDLVVKYHQGTLPGFDLRYRNAPVRIEPTVAAVRSALGR
jgi:threonine synthase